MFASEVLLGKGPMFKAVIVRSGWQNGGTEEWQEWQGYCNLQGVSSHLHWSQLFLCQRMLPRDWLNPKRGENKEIGWCKAGTWKLEGTERPKSGGMKDLQGLAGAAQSQTILYLIRSGIRATPPAKPAITCSIQKSTCRLTLWKCMVTNLFPLWFAEFPRWVIFVQVRQGFMACEGWKWTRHLLGAFFHRQTQHWLLYLASKTLRMLSVVSGWNTWNTFDQTTFEHARRRCEERPPFWTLPSSCDQLALPQFIVHSVSFQICQSDWVNSTKLQWIVRCASHA